MYPLDYQEVCKFERVSKRLHKVAASTTERCDGENCGMPFTLGDSMQIIAHNSDSLEDYKKGIPACPTCLEKVASGRRTEEEKQQLAREDRRARLVQILLDSVVLYLQHTDIPLSLV